MKRNAWILALAVPASDWITTRFPCRTNSPTANGINGARVSPT